MKMFWQRFVAALTPGVRVLLILLTVIYLASITGKLTSLINLSNWLAARSQDFWHGQIWRLVTYASLPMGAIDFALNAFALILLGAQLERHWTRGELWLFCVIAAAGAGFAQILFASTSPTGAAPVMFALLIAWAFVCGHETLNFPVLGQMRVQPAVFVFAAVSLGITFITTGLLRTFIMASGGLTGWLYLWLRHKWLMTRASRAVQSERITRLEL